MEMKEIKYDFSGRHILVVGASSGIGREVSESLLVAGARVSLIARREEKLREIAQKKPEMVDFAAADVRDYDGIADAISGFVKDHGKIDGLLYAAGVSSTSPIRNFDIAYEKKVMDTNYWGAVNTLKQALRRKNASDGASAVMISSVASAGGGRGLSTYSASKAAMKAMCRCAAAEYASRGYRINTVSFGWIPGTGMTNSELEVLPDSTKTIIDGQFLLRAGTVEDAAASILFLLSDASSWMTGGDITMDGGTSITKSIKK